MRVYLFQSILCLLFSASHYKCQLSGLYNVPATFTSLASAINALNAQGISSSVTIAISAGYSETAPVGGYSLYASGTNVNQIVFMKVGVGLNPFINAPSGGTRTPGASIQDGIWRFIGCDYVTIDGIDLFDGNTSNPQTMEFGFGLFKLNANDGCQNNLIKNCRVSLNRINSGAGSFPASDGSRGIEIVNATPNAHTTSLTVLSSSGSNSNNRFYSNTVQNCNIGFSCIGFSDVSPYNFADQNNEIGGLLSGTGNQILNFGGGGNVNASSAVRTQFQYNLIISGNTINNNNGFGVNHTTTLRGISIGVSPGANCSVNNNSITLHGGGTTSPITAIDNFSGSSGSSNMTTITNNHILNCSNNAATSGNFYGIVNSADASTLAINTNTFSGNSSKAASGSTFLIYNNAAVSSLIEINNNVLGFTFNGPSAYTGAISCIYNNGGNTTGTLNINNNLFSAFSFSNNTATGALNFINNAADFASCNLNSNLWNFLFLNHSGTQNIMLNSSSTQSVLSVCSNTVSNYYRLAGAGNLYGYYGTATSPATAIQTFSSNLFHNINAHQAGSGNFYGIYNYEGGLAPYPLKVISNNTVSAVSIKGSGTFCGLRLSDLGNSGNSQSSSIDNNVVKDVFFEGNVYGIHIAGSMSATNIVNVGKNLLHNLNSAAASGSVFGVYISLNNSAAHIFKNKITAIRHAGNSGNAFGLFTTGTTSYSITNNKIGQIETPFSNGANRVNGIFLGSGSNLLLAYNTIHLSAQSTAANFGSNALYATTTSTLELKNNIVINNSVSSGTGVAVAYRRSSSNASSYSSNSNNNIFYAGVPGSNNLIFQHSLTGFQTMNAFQTAFSPRESNSTTENVSFLSLLPNSPKFLCAVSNFSTTAESGAINIIGIADDFESEIRQGNVGYVGSGSNPDIGSDEFEENTSPCLSSNAGTITASALSLCAGEEITFTSQGFSQGTGIMHQWVFSNNATGPFGNVSGGNGATSPEYNTGIQNAGTYYFVLESTCISTSIAAASNQLTVVVNPSPIANAASTKAQYCKDDTIHFNTPLVPSAQYLWLGPQGFYSLMQNPTIINAGLNANGIYSLQVKSGNCASPISTLQISVDEVTLSVSANPNPVCVGDTSILIAVSNASVFSWNNTTSSPSISVVAMGQSIYSVVATASTNCSATQTIDLSIITPTLYSPGAVACDTVSSIVLSVTAFSPSIINWYSSINSSSVIATGSSYTLIPTGDTTFYAQAVSISASCYSSFVPVSLTVSTLPTLVATSLPATVCPGASATLQAFGAVSYSWNNGSVASSVIVNAVVGNVFTVSGSNMHGCISQTSISVGLFTPSPIVITPTISEICPQQPTKFTAAGANTYTWSHGPNGPTVTVAPAVNTSYTVFGTNFFGCSTSQSLAISTKSLPVISISKPSLTICPGEKIELSASGALSYTWLPGNVVSSLYSTTVFIASVFNVLGTGINGCNGLAFSSVEVDPCLGNKIFTTQTTEISVFPNPSDGDFFVKSEFKAWDYISVQDLSGKIIFANTVYEPEKEVNLREFAKGFYFISISVAGRVVNYKLTIQ